MKIKFPKQSNDFQEVSYSSNEEYALAIDAGNSEKNLIVCALQKNNNDYITIGITGFDIFNLPAEIEFIWEDNFIGEVIYYYNNCKRVARFDFSKKKGTFLEFGAWFERNDMPRKEYLSTFPEDLENIRSRFFCTKDDYAEFTIKSANGYWKAVDDYQHNYSFVIETQSGQCIIYACAIKPKQHLLSGIIIPNLISFPFKLKINFEQNYGAFSIDDDSLIGIYDFNDLSGILILPKSWETSTQD